VLHCDHSDLLLSFRLGLRFDCARLRLKVSLKAFVKPLLHCGFRLSLPSALFLSNLRPDLLHLWSSDRPVTVRATFRQCLHKFLQLAARRHIFKRS
jgi:hypothetical protein